MKILKTTNRTVGCAPFPNNKPVDGGLKKFADMVGGCKLVGLNVLVGTACSQTDPPFLEGDVVYVKGNCNITQWAKEKFTVEGVGEVIFVPVSEIIMEEHQDAIYNAKV